MRHKILYCLEQEQAKRPKLLEGVCEADETYILESLKGRKIPDDYHRCVCAVVERDGAAFSTAINRATPGKEELLNVFAGRVNGGTFCFVTGRKTMGFCLKVENV
jgi:hypothetical protein